jgi:hypothetical protein
VQTDVALGRVADIGDWKDDLLCPAMLQSKLDFQIEV